MLSPVKDLTVNKIFKMIALNEKVKMHKVKADW